jgi:hypothetical protein
LIAPLNRALTLTEVNDGAVMISDHLDLDMPGIRQVAFDIHVCIPEARRGQSPSRPQRLFQLRLIARDAHADAATASDGFEDYRIPQFSGDRANLVRVR